jgi:TonB family protein
VVSKLSMKLTIRVVLLTLALAAACWGQGSPKKSPSPECAKTIRIHGSLPKGPFTTRPNESRKQSPTVKYLIQEDGTVSNATITRSSGLSDMDKKLLDAIAKWKYKPRTSGCGAIEIEMAITIDLL